MSETQPQRPARSSSAKPPTPVTDREVRDHLLRVEGMLVSMKDDIADIRSGSPIKRARFTLVGVVATGIILSGILGLILAVLFGAALSGLVAGGA
ncbi:MAG: hypothetical protein AAGF47_03825 [Planctomycetota bacterium]